MPTAEWTKNTNIPRRVLGCRRVLLGLTEGAGAAVVAAIPRKGDVPAKHE